MSRGGDVRLRRARTEEAAALSALAFRSKAYWGYSDDFMAACRDELTLAPEQIEARPTYVLEAAGAIAGFYVLDPLSEHSVELDALFVEPDCIGRGYGRALIEHALSQARALGHRTLIIQGDPNAAAFYRRIGGRPAGTRASASIPGRVLPLFRVEL